MVRLTAVLAAALLGALGAEPVDAAPKKPVPDRTIFLESQDLG